MKSELPSLFLKPVSRTESDRSTEPLPLLDTGPYIVGRSSDADWPVIENSVSRRHAQLSFIGDQWFLTDLQSRNGTTVNGKQLEPGLPVPIATGDDISFGHWRCLCQSDTPRPGIATSFSDGLDAGARISAIDTSKLSGVAQRGLEALLNLTGDLESAKTLEEIAEAVVSSVHVATACRRIVIVRSVSPTQIKVLASTAKEPPEVSRSLLEAATMRGLVELVVAGNHENQARSIMDLNIRSAICAPILAGGSPAAFLMLDTRDAEGNLPADAAAFCQSVARLAGLSMEHLGAENLAQRHRQLQQDLDAARKAQELLSPPRSGSHGRVSYVFESIPGRIVAGDLFDFFPLDQARCAFFLGDVSGKGVGAAMLMAAAQSQLRTKLLSGVNLADAVSSVNKDLHARTEDSKFVTLIAGIVDTDRQTLQLVDAGHGFGVIVPPGGEPSLADVPNGFPLGVVETGEYESIEVPFQPDARVVLFSDGAVEQPSPDGTQLGVDAVLRLIATSTEPGETTNALIECVRHHAQAELSDDLTVACVQLLASPDDAA